MAQIIEEHKDNELLSPRSLELSTNESKESDCQEADLETFKTEAQRSSLIFIYLAILALFMGLYVLYTSYTHDNSILTLLLNFSAIGQFIPGSGEFCSLQLGFTLMMVSILSITWLSLLTKDSKGFNHLKSHINRREALFSICNNR